MNSKLKGSEFFEMRKVKFLNLKCHLTFDEKDSTIEKYFLPISRDSSYDATIHRGLKLDGAIGQGEISNSLKSENFSKSFLPHIGKNKIKC